MSKDGNLMEELMGNLAKKAKKSSYNALKTKPSLDDKSSPVSAFLKEISKENSKEKELFEQEEKKKKEKKKTK